MRSAGIIEWAVEYGYMRCLVSFFAITCARMAGLLQITWGHPKTMRKRLLELSADGLGVTTWQFRQHSLNQRSRAW